jgi:hypothetical protein
MQKEGKWGITLYGMYCLYKKKIEDMENACGADSVTLSMPDSHRDWPKVTSHNSRMVDYKTYCSVIREFNNKLAEALINEALEFTMPYRLGKLRIKKFKQNIRLDVNGDIDKKNMPVDWKSTKELWKKEYPGKTMEEIRKIEGKKRIFHLNEHTSGYRCKLHWDKIGCNVRNNRIYSAMFTFSNRRKLASMLKTDCKINYYE